MATIKDIAEHLGISVSTVSKGLNGANDISEELRQIVLDTAVEMGYTTKRMKKEAHKKLCVFIENMDYEASSHFGYDIILGFKQAASRDNWDVKVIPVTPAFQASRKYDTYMLRHGFSGAFLVGFALHDAWMKQVAVTNIPTALFDNYILKNPSVGYVGTDSFEGIDLSVSHLASLGHKRIAFLNGSLYCMVSDHRHQAFIDSMKAHGLPLDDDLIAYGHYVAASAPYHVPRFLKKGATAIVCGNDLIASGAIGECVKLGYRVPQDVSIIGFDDIPPSAQLDPPLTTIRQDRLELGKSGYYMLSSLLKKVSISKMLLRPQLIERQSTAPCRKESKEISLLAPEEDALTNLSL